MIDDGRWPAGHQVPPERELARTYGVSLITVRRALDELAREQRIERARGRGTFVLPSRIDRDLDEPLSFSEEMQRRGLSPQTRLIAAQPETAGEPVAAALDIEPGSPTLFVERLRLADGDPFLLEQAYLPAERFPGCQFEFSVQLAVPAVERPLRHGCRALARDIRAGRSALARGRAARP